MFLCAFTTYYGKTATNILEIFYEGNGRQICLSCEKSDIEWKFGASYGYWGDELVESRLHGPDWYIVKNMYDVLKILKEMNPRTKVTAEMIDILTKNI